MLRLRGENGRECRETEGGQEAGADGRAVGRAGSRVLVLLCWLSGWGRGVKGRDPLSSQGVGAGGPKLGRGLLGFVTSAWVPGRQSLGQSLRVISFLGWEDPEARVLGAEGGLSRGLLRDA